MKIKLLRLVLKMTNSWDPEKKTFSARSVQHLHLHPSMNGRLSSWQVWQDWRELYIPSVFELYLLQSSNLEKKTQKLLKNLVLIHQFPYPLDHLPYQSRCETSWAKALFRRAPVAKVPAAPDVFRKAASWWNPWDFGLKTEDLSLGTKILLGG